MLTSAENQQTSLGRRPATVPGLSVETNSDEEDRSGFKLHTTAGSDWGIF